MSSTNDILKAEIAKLKAMKTKQQEDEREQLVLAEELAIPR